MGYLFTEPSFPLVKPSHAPLLFIIGANLPPGSTWDWTHAACRASPVLTRLTTSDFSLGRFPITNLTKLHLVDQCPCPRCYRFSSMRRVSKISHSTSKDRAWPAPSWERPCHEVGFNDTKHLQGSPWPVSRGDRISGLENIGIHQIDHWPDADLCSFLSRSSCALTSLDFYDVYISQEQIIACLQHKACNTLESLAVRQCFPPVATALLRHLTCHRHLLPNINLRAIEFSTEHSPLLVCGGYSFEPRDLPLEAAARDDARL